MDEATIQNLSKKQQHAALLVAEDELIDQQIAEAVGVSRVTLYTWKKRPDFAELVTALRARFRDRIMVEGFADKTARVRSLNRLARKVEDDLNSPATDLKPAGTYRKEVKMSANGEIADQEVFDKPKFDTFRGLLDDIAKELGDRRQGVDATLNASEQFIAAMMEWGTRGRDA